MKILKQIVMTIYDTGDVRVTERSVSRRDEATGRFVANEREVGVEDETPVFPEFEQYMKETA